MFPFAFYNAVVGSGYSYPRCQEDGGVEEGNFKGVKGCDASGRSAPPQLRGGGEASVVKCPEKS